MQIIGFGLHETELVTNINVYTHTLPVWVATHNVDGYLR